MRCSVIVVGDEILAGHVVDANAPFLLERILTNGHEVRRVVIVGDDPELIAADVRAELAGRIDLLFVCGGLGPTHDDRTMEAVAQALKVPLVECTPLARLIEEVLANAARAGFSEGAMGAQGFRKMALVPEGADLLRCSAGVVPAVLIERGATTIVVLPGPPRELRAVFTESVEPRYLTGRGQVTYSEEITHEFPEASLASLLAELQARHPDTTIGSYPRAVDALIRITGSRADVSVIADVIRRYIDEVSATEEGERLIGFMAARRAGRLGAESG